MSLFPDTPVVAESAALRLNSLSHPQIQSISPLGIFVINISRATVWALWSLLKYCQFSEESNQWSAIGNAVREL